MNPLVIHGTTQTQYTPASSSKECQLYCQYTKGCYGFTWSRGRDNKNQCWIKNALASPVDSDYAISGPRHCDKNGIY